MRPVRSYRKDRNPEDKKCGFEGAYDLVRHGSLPSPLFSPPNTNPCHGTAHSQRDKDLGFIYKYWTA